jgi:hypothetical protein
MDLDFDRKNDNWKMYQGNPNEEEVEEEEVEEEDPNAEVCVYCGDERNNRFQCCSENHWVKRSEF